MEHSLDDNYNLGDDSRVYGKLIQPKDGRFYSRAKVPKLDSDHGVRNDSNSKMDGNGPNGDLTPTHCDSKEDANETFSMDEAHSMAANASSPSAAQKMMMSMGFEEGKGLGKYQQGMTAPISASLQRGRRGLGFSIKGLEPRENLIWDKSKEYIVVEENVCWLPPNNDKPLIRTLLSTWIKEGLKKKDISNQTEFCLPEILAEILTSKSVFDTLSEKEMYKGRTRSNPFETIGKLFFQNRAALKMANIDSVFDFMFTQPVDQNGHSLVDPKELLYFADVCAAPGGFSEYILWKRKSISNGFCDAKGFGFTLKENDFRLDDFFAAPPEFLEPHYGVSGLLGTGDVYVPDNITNFRKFVLKSTGGKGVHFMMADGGFSVEGQENIQEILSKQLYLCQFLVALGIVRAGGHFVCKLFDIFTPFSVGLVYIMYRCFHLVALHKPNSSRPANSERYIVCKWRKDDVEDCYNHLFEVNLKLRSYSIRDDKDIAEVVPCEVLKADEDFEAYIYDSNNVLGERQVVSLQKIQAFCQDLNLSEDQQIDIRVKCLQFWQLPDRPRVAPVRMDPKEKAASLLDPEQLRQFVNHPTELSPDNLEVVLRSCYDYRFVLLASPKDMNNKSRGFFLGLGGSNIYYWNGKEAVRWSRCETRFELPVDTLLFGEVVVELRGEAKAQRKVNAFHVIDALILNGLNIMTLHLVERYNYMKKFASAINKESRNDLAPIRCKTLYKLEDIEDILRPPLLSKRHLKGVALRRVYCEYEGAGEDPARYTVPTGVFFLKMTQDPWMMAYSKSMQRKYWFNTLTRQSTFDTFPEVIAPISVSYSHGAFWWWEDGVKILEDENFDSKKLHLERFLNHSKKLK